MTSPPPPPLTPIEVGRFWRKVREQKRGYATYCYIWTASRNPKGYGQFRSGGTMRLAHRIAWFLYFGTWPDVLCHYCDQADCVRPSHLWEGTRAENVADMIAKGRARYDGARRRGTAHPHAKLTEEAVIALRRDHVLGLSQYELAAKYGISRPTAKSIIHRQTWTHI